MKRYVYILVLFIFLLTGCKSKVYKVTIMDDDNVLASVNVLDGDNFSKMPIPKKDGYVFVSWLKDGKTYDVNNKISDNLLLTIKWIKEPSIVKNFEVTFNYGSYSKKQTVKAGDKVSRPEHDPVLDKYTFLGWYSGESLYDFDLPVDKDLVINAKYEKSRITITYDLDGGSGVLETEINKNSIPNKPKNPTKFGYKFINWILDGKPYNFDFPLDRDTTIKANFEAIIYVKVTFDTDGGNDIKSEMLESGKTLDKLPLAIKEGYKFKCWMYLDKEFDINTKITKDIILIASYDEIEEGANS